VVLQDVYTFSVYTFTTIICTVHPALVTTRVLRGLTHAGCGSRVRGGRGLKNYLYGLLNVESLHVKVT